MTHTHDELQAVKPLRQEQEQAEELVTEIAEGIYRMQLPVLYCLALATSIVTHLKMKKVSL